MRKILFSPMSAIARTAVPSKRVGILASECMKVGIETAVCAAHDINFRKIEGAKEYPLDIPMPFGMPGFIAKRTYPFAEKTGIIGRKTVHSFEEVLHITGTTSYPYLARAVKQEREAIRDFAPDIVYSEFSIPAIIAALAENIKLVCTVSYPASAAYASSPQYAEGVNRLLGELGISKVSSTLELFDRAALRIVASSRELEPVDGENVLFTGPFEGEISGAGSACMNGKAGGQSSGCSLNDSDSEYMKNKTAQNDKQRRGCIVVYMGTGTIPAKKLISTITGAFGNADDPEVFVSCSGVEPFDKGNIHVAHSSDFSELLPRASVFINHGGQNSVMDGLRYGVPQLICPSRIFERQYNARSIAENGAGLVVSLSEFLKGSAANGENVGGRNASNRNADGYNANDENADGKAGGKTIADFVHELSSNASYTIAASRLWTELSSLGGAARAVEKNITLMRCQSGLNRWFS